MGTTIAMAYKIPVRLCYVAVAYKNLCMPQKTIPSIAIFLVVGISAWHAPPTTKDSCPAPGTCMESTRKKPIAVGKQKTSLRGPGT
jgi:hypothetical protein